MQFSCLQHLLSEIDYVTWHVVHRDEKNDRVSIRQYIENWLLSRGSYDYD